MKQYNAKILVVDDSPENLKLIGNSLKNQNYMVLTALNGKQAIALIDNKNPDIIVLDVMMPEMDGFEVCEIIKSKEKSADIPVIFITALNDQESIKHGYNVGAVEYLSKPININDLLIKIKVQIRNKRRNDYTSKYIKLLECINQKNKANLHDNTFAKELLKKKYNYFEYSSSLFKIDDIESTISNYTHHTNEILIETKKNSTYYGYIIIDLIFTYLNTITSANNIIFRNTKINTEEISEDYDLIQVHSYSTSACINKLRELLEDENKSHENKTFHNVLSLLNAKIKFDKNQDSELFEIEILLEKKKKTKHNINSKKALIIEDNVLNQDYLKSLLDGFNITSDIAENSETAFKKNKNNDYDIIFLDINLPEVNGFEICNLLRTKYNYNKPIISISGHSILDIKNKCLEYGFSDFLNKPFSTKDLEKIFIKHLKLDININEDEKVDENQHYSFDKARELANGDEKLLILWLNNLCEILEKAFDVVQTLKEKQEYQKGTKVFHDLINNSTYFNLTILVGLINELQNIDSSNSNINFTKTIYKIEEELKNANNFYHENLKILKMSILE